MPSSSDKPGYSHDIGKWALVKYCGYPLETICPDASKIPDYVLHSLKKQTLSDHTVYETNQNTHEKTP